MKRALEIDPVSVPFSRGLGVALYYSRQYDRAIEQLRKTLELDPNFLQAHDFLGMAYVRKSMVKEGLAEAQKVLDQLNDLSKHKYIAAMNVAGIYVGLGDKDKAFEWLEKAYEEGFLYNAKVDPIYDPLRSDPRFTDLLRRTNLQP
jgi:tetratricopeptide (TPR) repeat protein